MNAYPTALLRTFAFGLLMPAVAVAQTATPPHLIPLPREVHLGTATAASSVLVLVPGNDAEDQQAAQDLSEALHARGIHVTPNVGRPVLTVSLLRTDSPEAEAQLQAANMSFSPEMQAEGYVLLANAGAVSVIAETASGVFYGVQTLKQMLHGNGAAATLDTGAIKDWPAMRYRGIDDDLSRGPFPTLAFQKEQIRTFAAYKINIYSPYFEDTMQYAGSTAFAPQGRSLTRAEAQELVRYAARYHVIIVPEQEAFGHLHKLLQYEKFSDLAENPHGSVLAPGQPGTQPLIASWFTQLAEDYPSPFLHIGADETFELGNGRTKEDVQKRGLGPVYADFLTQIHSTLAPLHRRLLYWGDIAWSDPSAIAGLPKDMIAIPWVYWHEDNYDKNILPFKQAGIETWVAPGDSNWSVMYPLGSHAIDNISGFIEAGQRLGSTGALTTVWNDDGEGLFNQDWFGVMFGSAASWQPGRSSGAPYQAAFGELFYNDTTGKVMQAESELIAATDLFDVSDDVFWMDPWSKAGQAKAAKLRPSLHATRLHAEHALELLAEAKAENPQLAYPDAIAAMELGAHRIDFAAMKFQFADEMATAYANAYALHRDKKQHTATRTWMEAITGFSGGCTDLRNGYSALKQEYRTAWLAENRPAWLDNVLVQYDMQMQLWQGRSDHFNQILRDWDATGVMPTAQEAGIGEPATATAAAKAPGK